MPAHGPCHLSHGCPSLLLSECRENEALCPTKQCALAWPGLALPLTPPPPPAPPPPLLLLLLLLSLGCRAKGRYLAGARAPVDLAPRCYFWQLPVETRWSRGPDECKGTPQLSLARLCSHAWGVGGKGIRRLQNCCSAAQLGSALPPLAADGGENGNTYTS